MHRTSAVAGRCGRLRRRASGYEKLTDHAWLLIVKDPDPHAGDKVIIYGVVTQFDAATGNGTFRADAGPTANEGARPGT